MKIVLVLIACRAANDHWALQLDEVQPLVRPGEAQPRRSCFALIKNLAVDTEIKPLHDIVPPELLQSMDVKVFRMQMTVQAETREHWVLEPYKTTPVEKPSRKRKATDDGDDEASGSSGEEEKEPLTDDSFSDAETLASLSDAELEAVDEDILRGLSKDPILPVENKSEVRCTSVRLRVGVYIAHSSL